MSSLQTSAAIVSFLERSLQDVINDSSKPNDYPLSFNKLFAENVKVISNGSSISRGDFEQHFREEHSFASSPKVNFIAITVAAEISEVRL